MCFSPQSLYSFLRLLQNSLSRRYIEFISAAVEKKEEEREEKEKEEEIRNKPKEEHTP